MLHDFVNWTVTGAGVATGFAVVGFIVGVLKSIVNRLSA